MGEYKIAVMDGDGIGPEIVREAVKVLSVINELYIDLKLDFTTYPIGLKAFEENGSTLPDITIQGLIESDAGLLGPLTTHEYDVEDKNMENASGKLRKYFDLYANIRPAKSFEGVNSNFKNVDLVIVRENTEGMYADRNLFYNSGEFMTDADTALSVRLVTRKGSTRLGKIALELASARKKKLTIVHKKNVLRKTCGLFYDSVIDAANDYPDINIDDYHIDAFAMHLIQRPANFDVIATTNMFGDILSDQAAGLVGGLGLAPGLNLGDNFMIAQATHGSAPDIANQGLANPISEILSAKMMLEWLGVRNNDKCAIQASKLINDSVEITLKEGKMTRDLDGTLSTAELGDRLVENIREKYKEKMVYSS